MKLLIDSLSDKTNWVVNSPSTIVENEVEEFIAGYNNSKSLLIHFNSGDSVKTATKTFSAIDVTNYSTLILNVWSQNKSYYHYRKSNDFSYKIKLNATQEFYLPIYPTFTSVNIGIEDVTSIDRIEITALHSDNDYIVISEMIVEEEEIGYDVLNAVKEQVEYYINQKYGDGINVGTVTASVNASSITLSNPLYIDRYSVVKIKNGSNSEIHQIGDCDGSTFYFSNNYDGETLLNSYTNADVFLTFPIYLNPGQMDVRLPGIAIWGLDPEPILRGSKLDKKVETFRVSEDDFKQLRDGQLKQFVVLIDIEARSIGLRSKMADVVSKFIGREVLWINGRYHEIYFNGKPTEQRSLEGVDIIPKIQYALQVEVKQNLYDRVVIPKMTDLNINLNITT